MGTIRQKRIAKLIVENAHLDKPLNAGEIVKKGSYSKSMQIKPSVVIKSEGVIEELAILGFTENNAKNVVAEILLNPDAEDNARLKAADQVFKVHGTYAAEKREVKVEDKTEATSKIIDLTNTLNDLYRGRSITSNGEATRSLDTETPNQ